MSTAKQDLGNISNRIESNYITPLLKEGDIPYELKDAVRCNEGRCLNITANMRYFLNKENIVVHSLLCGLSFL